VLVYRIPSEPASKRVAIWRDLKRTGALYLQQCVKRLTQPAHKSFDESCIYVRATLR
jgi:hypothetical protein